MQSTLAIPQVLDAPASTADARAGKYLVFRLGSGEFGVCVGKVREIIGLQEITAVPRVPAYVKGVINLRGGVIPVVDLRRKIGLPEVEPTWRTCIIVVQEHGNAHSLPTGILVDAVVEMLSVAAGEIENPPDFGPESASPCLLGVAHSKDKVKLLLDIDQVLSSSGMCRLSSLAQSF